MPLFSQLPLGVGLYFRVCLYFFKHVVKMSPQTNFTGFVGFGTEDLRFKANYTSNTKVHLKMIGTGGFLRRTSEIGIESQQTWYRSTPWPEWNIRDPFQAYFDNGGSNGIDRLYSYSENRLRIGRPGQISDIISRQRKTAATNGQCHSIRRYRNMLGR